MRLSLIGMAGAGKSYWSRHLAGHGFRCFCCDDMIEERLASELRRPGGRVLSMGEWMGFPFVPGYGERESRYLALEAEVVGEILRGLETPESPREEDVVVDTSGSVIYAGDDLLQDLRKKTTVVYLMTPPEVRDRLLEAYLLRPHPMLWRGLFDRKEGETERDALARSYAALFSERQGLYDRLAHARIDYALHHRKDFGVKELLAEISSQGV